MSELRVTVKGGTVLMDVYVVPRASRAGLVGVHDGALKVALLVPPVEGAANRALIALLAKQLGLAKRDVRIVRGLTSRHKTVALAGAQMDAVRSMVRGL